MSITQYIIDNNKQTLTGQYIHGNLSADTFFANMVVTGGDLTHSELFNKIVTSGLAPGSTYRITDFRTVNLLHGQLVSNNQYPTQTIPAGSFDPDFRNLKGFDDGVHAIKEVELGSFHFQGLSYERVDVEYGPSMAVSTGDFTIEWFQYFTGATNPNACRKYIVTNDDSSFQPISWTDCEGGSNNANVSPGDTIFLCAIEGSVVYNPTFFEVVDEGACYQGPKVFSVGSYGTAAIAISFENENKNCFWWNGSPVPYEFTLDTPIQNRWVHFAIVRNSGTIKIYQNGTEVYSGNHPESLGFLGRPLTIGNEQSDTGPFKGYITNFRFVPTTAVYTSEFTVPTKPLADLPDTAILFKTMSKAKITRNSISGTQLEVNNYLVNWSKLTPFENERKIYLGGDFRMYENDYAQSLIRINQDGTIDRAFNIQSDSTSTYSGFSGVIKCIEIQDDGKLLVGGNFERYNDRYCGYLVRLNDDGSQDMGFQTSIDGNGFNGTVRSIVPLADGSMLVGGSFDFYYDSNNSTNADFICRLDSDGFCDQNYIASNGYSLNGSVYVLKQESPSISGTSFYVGGEFTSWTSSGSGTTNANRIIKLDSNWNYDSSFFIENGGFDRRVFDIAIQDDNKIVVVGGANSGGAFTEYTYSGSPYNANGIIRLNDDASVDITFGTGFNSYADSVDLLGDGRIVVGGGFTSFDGTTFPYVALLNTDGTPDPTFNTDFNPGSQVIKVKTLSDENILCGGWFSSMYSIGGRLGYVAKYLTSSRESAFIWSGTNVGDVEPLVVRAVTECSLDTFATSEMFPNDVIEYNPYCSSVGCFYGVYNGYVTPSGNTVSGFDLKWDGSNVYFDMPSGITVSFGNPFGIYASFGGDNYELDIVNYNAIPSVVGMTLNSNASYYLDRRLGSRTTVSSDGTRIYLNDLHYHDFTAYDADSLSFYSLMPLQPAYGKIIRRSDECCGVSVPFDFRGIRYRRYEMALQNAIFTYEPDYIGLYDNLNNQSYNCTGRYYDFPVFGFDDCLFQNIRWTTVSGLYESDNNIFLGDFHDNEISGFLFNNTVIYDFSANRLEGQFQNNITFEFRNNRSFGDFNYNQFNSSFLDNILGRQFNGNLILNSFYNNTSNVGFTQNKVHNSFFDNTIGSNFNNNELFGNFFYNRISSSFYGNKIMGSFVYNNTRREFWGNVFSGNTDDCDFQLFQRCNARDDMHNTYFRVYQDLYDFGNPAKPNSAYVSNPTYSKEIIGQNGGANYISLLSGGTMVYLTL